MKKISAIMVALVAIGLWSAMAFGQPHWGMRGMGPGMMRGDTAGMFLPLVLKGVNLAPEQETRVQEIMAAHRATLRNLFQQMRQTHEELSDKMLTPGDLQSADLTPYVQRLTQLREQLMQEGVKVALQVRAVLTPEQLAKASELKSRMKSLHTEMRNLFKEKD
jgi:Spy/CpxP family protein refolding chaperone